MIIHAMKSDMMQLYCMIMKTVSIHRPISGRSHLLSRGERQNSCTVWNQCCLHSPRVCCAPWNAAENKFICPCHGSQYNNQGKVVRGPAPLVSKTRIHPFLFEYDLTKNAFIGPGMNSALEVVLEEK